MLMHIGQYNLALTEMDKLRKQIKHEPNNLEDLWFVTYNTGWVYYKRRQFDIALRYGKLASKYSHMYAKEVSNVDKIKSMDFIARTHLNMLDTLSEEQRERRIIKVKRVLLRVSVAYHEAGNYRMELSVLFDIAKIDKNKKEMYGLMLQVRDSDNTTYSNFYKDTDKQNLLNSMESELLTICLKDRDTIMVRMILESLGYTDKEVKCYLQDNNLLIINKKVKNIQ
jgi:tetratricopeptide (TPR) repeat protein